ncbi:hypothetical protein CVT25_004129 [Psilocybe cyanescens]|uniref:ABC transporter domain-containing protein n=1 Tax=Psilocybe cyanescens TaxID=93625 RepID=A0A409XKS1_PSICY|nr:hypothetical protein CVT25_004129 [Psilocybe cyanescens]
MSLKDYDTSTDIDISQNTSDVDPSQHLLTTSNSDRPKDANGVDLSEENTMSTKGAVNSGNSGHSQDTSCVNLPKPRIRFTTWGIFDIVYEVSGPIFPSFLSPSSLGAYQESFPSFLRLLKDLWGLCKWRCVHYYACMLWLALAPSVSLYFASLIILNVEILLQENDFGGIVNEALKENLRYQIVGWLLCGLLAVHARRTSYEARATIGIYLRAYFIPKLAEASLKLDRSTLNESHGSFPNSTAFGDFAPGWEPIENIFHHIRHVLVVVFEIISMTVIIYRFNEPFDAFAMSCLMTLFFIATLLAPRNGAGGGTFAYWTENKHYHRMHTLFSSVFNYEYRPYLFRDGLVDYFLEEYRRASSALGIVKSDMYVLAFRLPVPWYWDIASSLVTEYPMELSAVFILWASSSSIISTIIIFQYAMSTIHGSIQGLAGAAQTGPVILNSMDRVKRLYRLLDEPLTNGGSVIYPTSETSTGASIEIRKVSYKYSSEGHLAVDDVSLSIKSGQLVVITGVNGSGKSTLVKLISGLIQPTSGGIVVDNNSLQLYDGNKFREAIVFLEQNEFIYNAFSLRENLLLGIPNGPRLAIKEKDLDEAALQGGSLDLIKRHGYNTVLRSESLPHNSAWGNPGEAAMAVYRKKGPKVNIIPISNGEHQRFIASRAFLRLKHGNIKLIILDEPTNALDTIAEAKVFENFRNIAQRNGQTMIIVSHRLVTVAKHADLIVCMNKGRIAEKGTHQDLVASRGQYASLYNAQVL